MIVDNENAIMVVVGLLAVFKNTLRCCPIMFHKAEVRLFEIQPSQTPRECTYEEVNKDQNVGGRCATFPAIFIAPSSALHSLSS
jgi:hypothetical protein